MHLEVLKDQKLYLLQNEYSIHNLQILIYRLLMSVGEVVDSGVDVYSHPFSKCTRSPTLPHTAFLDKPSRRGLQDFGKLDTQVGRIC